MKPILIFDTETTGLPVWDKPSEDPCQPRVTSLCAELCDDDTGDTLAMIDTLIRPDGWTIPPEVVELTGITTEKCQQLGMPMTAVLPMLMHLWERSAFRVAHNESFDMRMIRIEIMRHHVLSTLPTPEEKSYADLWKGGKAFCTMSKSTAIVNLPPSEKMRATGRKGPKSPTLAEAFAFFTGCELVGAHSAHVDVSACKQVYFELKKRQAA